MKSKAHILWAAGIMLVLSLAAIAFRPLLPIDETRYMTVAWEMRLQNGWLAPLTMNFAPYHHKPPMLFWLINLFWSIFGISRWAGLIPVALMSFTAVLLTIRLGKKLSPPDVFDPVRTAFLMCGSVPFLIYGTLIMFDLTVTVFVLSALLCLVTYAEKRQFRYMALLSLFLGLAVLTKGPVGYLYTIFPMLLGPFWVKDFNKPVSWYGDCVAGIVLSIIPVSIWLGPVLAHSDNQFAFSLLWEQTAGRVTGKFNDAHARPFYFYVPVLLVLTMPWICFPTVWKSFKFLDRKNTAIRFAACWLIPTIYCFCVISGKQPHYLLPLLPGVVLIFCFLLQKAPLVQIRNVMLLLVAAICIGQGIASKTAFKKYDLAAVADYVSRNRERSWAYVRNYHGEIGFLARLTHPVEDKGREDIAQWFVDNPDGLAIIRYKDEEEVGNYEMVLTHPYRGKHLGIFKSGVNLLPPPRRVPVNDP